MRIKKSTIIRTIVLFIALINQILVSAGKPVVAFDSDMTTELVTNLFTILASAWAWWKNNSFTYEAIVADEELKNMKG